MTTPFSPEGFFDQWLRFFPQGEAGPGAGRPAAGDEVSHSPLRSIADFGPNPGNLRLRAYLPESLGAGAPLVVVLHGCRQGAAEYLEGSGWGELAARHGFALALPEQQPMNNPNLCFNWFEPTDIARGTGEVASIAAMIRFLVGRHGLDPARVYITGLSAGGAMAGAMLATYPELFAGAAIIAGLPFGAAASAHEAFGVMGQGRIRPAEELAERVRLASAHAGPWPPVSLWQGEADHVVNPVNAQELAKQWTAVMGLSEESPEQDEIAGAMRATWRDATGKARLTLYRIPALGHAAPITPEAAEPAARIGDPAASRFILPGPISSTWQIAEDWGLTGAPAAPGAAAGGQARAATRPQPRPAPAPALPLLQKLLPTSERIEALAREVACEVAGEGTPLGRLLRAGGITPPGRPVGAPPAGPSPTQSPGRGPRQR